MLKDLLICGCNTEWRTGLTLTLSSSNKPGSFEGLQTTDLASLSGCGTRWTRERWRHPLKTQKVQGGFCAQPHQRQNFNGLQQPCSFLFLLIMFLCSCGTAVGSQSRGGRRTFSAGKHDSWRWGQRRGGGATFVKYLLHNRHSALPFA